MEGPRERARHHRGLALSALGLPGAEVGDLRQRLNGLSHEAQQQTIANAITLSDRHADTDEGVGKYQEPF